MTDFSAGIKTYGDPRRPPLLFLHGVRLAGRIWDEHARRLSDQYYVVAPDLPGHGALTNLPFEVPVIEAFLAFISTSVVQTPPLVIGYSLGGYVAMRYALDMPERTAGLLLAGCTTDITGARAHLYDLAVRAGARLPDAVLDRFLAAFFRATLPRRLADLIIPFPFNGTVFSASREVACGHSYSSRLRSYGKPVMVVNGEWDFAFRRDEAKYVHNGRACVHVLRRATHIGPIDRVNEFTALVRRFAERVFGTTANSGADSRYS